MTGTARLGKGARQEAGSEGSRRPQLGLDEQKPDTGSRGGATRQWTGTPNRHPDTHGSKSGGDRVKQPRLTLGDLPPRPDDPDYRPGNRSGQGGRSQPRP